MMKRVESGNKTMFYLGTELMLTVTVLGNDRFVVENSINRLEGVCKNLDDHRTQVRLEKNYTKGKNGRLYNSKKLLSHNTKWFCYILQEEGFVKKTVPA